jgi:hypothetical protein
MRNELNEIKLKLNEMKELIDSENSSENEDNLNDLYIELKELLDFANDGSVEYNGLLKRFKNLSSEFENPDDIRSGSIDMMFPDDF